MEQNSLTHAGVKGMKWGIRRYQNSDGSLTNAGRKRYSLKRAKEPEHEDYTKAHGKKDIKSMSNQELRERNNRLNMEKQYRDLTKKTSTGKKLVSAYIATGATVAGIMTATAAYKKLGNGIVAKAGDMVVKGIKIGKLTN